MEVLATNEGRDQKWLVTIEQAIHDMASGGTNTYYRIHVAQSGNLSLRPLILRQAQVLQEPMEVYEVEAQGEVVGSLKVPPGTFPAP